MNGAAVGGAERARPDAREHLKLLLGLHGKILYRQATSSTSRAWLTGALLVLGFVASLLLGGVVFGGFRFGARPEKGFTPAHLFEASHLLFTMVFGIVALSPVLGFRGNEFFDVTKLFVLPVSHRTVFAAMTLGLTLSGAVLFWLLPLGGAVLGLPGLTPVTAVLRLLLVLAFLLHAVAVGQFLVLVLLGFLRSRRYRDLLLVAAPIVGGGFYLGLRWLSSGWLTTGNVKQILGEGWSRWLAFLPSRWLTEALAATGPGPPEPARWLPFLVGFVPITWLLFRAAADLQARAFLGEVPAEAAAGSRPGARWRGARLLARWFPDPVLAVASKEVRTLRREPLVKTILINQAVFLVLPFLFATFRPHRQDAGPDRTAQLLWAALPFTLVFVESTLAMNLLGLEGSGIEHLLTTPASWRHLLVGKDLCYLVAFGALNLGITSAVLGGTHLLRPDLVPDPGGALWLAALGGTCGLAIVLAAGNVLSVFLPTPLTVKGRMALRQQRALREGCLEQIVRTLVFAGTAVLVAPVPFMLQVLPAVARGFDEAWWPPLAAVLSVTYAGVLLAVSVGVAAGAAEERRGIILARLVRSEE